MTINALLSLKRAPTSLSLTHRSQGPFGEIWEFICPEAEGSITVIESHGKVILETIDVQPMGTGVGSKIVEGLRDYCQSSGKRLLIPKVMNLEFFSHFDWLDWNEPDPGQSLWAASWSPNITKSADQERPKSQQLV